MKFRRKQLVRHIRTGGVYRIVHTPQVCRLEAMNEPAYAYKLVTFDGVQMEREDSMIWVRQQAEMEDGRFEAVEAP